MYCCSKCHQITQTQAVRSTPGAITKKFNHNGVQSDHTLTRYDARWTVGTQETVRLFIVPTDIGENRGKDSKEWYLLHVAGRLSSCKPTCCYQLYFGRDDASEFLARRGWIRNDLEENAAWISETTS